MLAGLAKLDHGEVRFSIGHFPSTQLSSAISGPSRPVSAPKPSGTHDNGGWGCESAACWWETPLGPRMWWARSRHFVLGRAGVAAIGR